MSGWRTQNSIILVLFASKSAFKINREAKEDNRKKIFDLINEIKAASKKILV
jgi:hypothetical protein